MRLKCRSPRVSKGVIKTLFVGKNLIAVVIFALCVSAVNISAQDIIPKPGPARSVNVPAAKETKLDNGLTVAVVEKKDVPLVTIRLLVRAGASSESSSKAGLADLTASMLTKGTKTRSATQIAQDVEFLGGSINSGADWNGSYITITVASDKVEQAMAILADVVLNPSFPQDELDLLKSQAADGLKYNLSQPGFLANYVASKYSYGEHPAGGTPESIVSITTKDVSAFYDRKFKGKDCVLIFTGDVDSDKAVRSARELFGRLPAAPKMLPGPMMSSPEKPAKAQQTFARLLIVDLAGSGQASVSYHYAIGDVGRRSAQYYIGSALNSVLGGGYSSRLNQEIRIKRGLSYGAGSSFAWRGWNTNFGTRTQTKNESAGEVATLLVDELEKIAKTDVAEDELIPRKAVLTGNFGRRLETTSGLAAAVSEFYTFGLPGKDLNYYMPSINNVTPKQIKDFASDYLLGGDIIIVGDYSIFKDDLAKRFPDTKFDVIKADELDITKPNLRK
jgi:zinc protease